MHHAEADLLVTALIANVTSHSAHREALRPAERPQPSSPAGHKPHRRPVPPGEVTSPLPIQLREPSRNRSPARNGIEKTAPSPAFSAASLDTGHPPSEGGQIPHQDRSSETVGIETRTLPQRQL